MSQVSGKYAAIAGAALVIAALLFAYFFLRAPQATDQNFSKEFSLVLPKFDGTEVHLYEYRRQIIVAYAWASWCVYCGEELKHLAELKKTYGDKIQILAVNRAEPESTAKEYIGKLGLGNDITLLLDPNDTFFKSIGGYAMPETVFINAAGNIVFHQRGPIDIELLQSKMKELVQ